MIKTIQELDSRVQRLQQCDCKVLRLSQKSRKNYFLVSLFLFLSAAPDQLFEFVACELPTEEES